MLNLRKPFLTGLLAASSVWLASCNERAEDTRGPTDFLATVQNEHNAIGLINLEHVDFETYGSVFDTASSERELCASALVHNYLQGDPYLGNKDNHTLNTAFARNIRIINTDLSTPILYQLYDLYHGDDQAVPNHINHSDYRSFVEAAGQPNVAVDLLWWQIELEFMETVHNDEAIQDVLARWDDPDDLSMEERLAFIERVSDIKTALWGAPNSSSGFYEEDGEVNGTYNSIRGARYNTFSGRSFWSSDTILGLISHEIDHHIQALLIRQARYPGQAGLVERANALDFNDSNLLAYMGLMSDLYHPHPSDFYRLSPKEHLAFERSTIWKTYHEDGFEDARLAIENYIDQAETRASLAGYFQTRWEQRAHYDCTQGPSHVTRILRRLKQTANYQP